MDTSRGGERLGGRLNTAMQFLGGLAQGLIEGPQCHSVEHCCGEEMHIDPPSSLPKELVRLNKTQNFLVLNGRCGSQCGQRIENFGPVLHVATRQFPNDEWVTEDSIFVQHAPQNDRVATKVIDPHRGIDQCQHTDADRRRRIFLRCGSMPPR